MPVKIERLGPGQLTLGSGALAVQSQLTSCSIVPAENVDTEEGLTVLSGETLPESSTQTYTASLVGEFLQDFTAAGIVAYSWSNKGVTVPFTFKPNAGGASFTGQLIPVPLQAGGTDVGKRMTAAFTWRCVGFPVPTWSA